MRKKFPSVARFQKFHDQHRISKKMYQKTQIKLPARQNMFQPFSHFFSFFKLLD